MLKVKNRGNTKNFGQLCGTLLCCEAKPKSDKRSDVTLFEVVIHYIRNQAARTKPHPVAGADGQPVQYYLELNALGTVHLLQKTDTE